MSTPDAKPAAHPAAAELGGELALQRRWAEGRWPSPWLRLEPRESPAGEQRPAPAADQLGPPLRVCFAGRWNRAAGPDFRDAILLDADGRARRGDIELHRRAAGWRQHGHHTDPAYARVFLHVLGAGPDNAQQGAPPAALLAPGGSAAAPPPCADVLQRAGPAAVAARLRRLGCRRLQRKAEFLRRRLRPEGESDPDELAAWALARALAMPHNAELLGAALEQAWPETRSADPSAWSATLRDQLHSAAARQPGWRAGRGALGRRAGAVEILITLLQRWGRDGAADAVRRLAGLKPGAAVELLRIPRRLGPARSRQLLADAVYPAALALGEPPGPIGQRWLSLPAARYLRTDPLRDRLSPREVAGAPGALRWRHAGAQALLELEHGWCRQGACAVCPLGRLNRARRPPPGALVPSLNLPGDV